MKLGIIGLPQTGKKSIFSLLTGNKISADSNPQKLNSGQAEIRDKRFNELVEMFEPKKEVSAKIDMILFPKIEENTIKDGNIFNDIADMDAVCHIVRAFTDDSIYHIDGSVNPKRDIEKINSELILYDLLFIEKRFERIKKASMSKKKDDKTGEPEIKILNRFRDHLENDNHLRTLELNDDENKIIAGYPFITIKEMLIVLNVGDNEISSNKLLQDYSEKFDNQGIKIMQVSVKLESEIAMLDTEEERQEFMVDAGIKEPALNILSKLAMDTLGLMSFFTVGKDEVRQWLIKKGSTAPIAGGVIHSDIQRGFIRVEVMKYGDLIELGSEESLKKAGKFHVLGKDYIIEDGDIAHFRFNV